MREFSGRTVRPARRMLARLCIAACWLLTAVFGYLCWWGIHAKTMADDQPQPPTPVDWGNDHVGQTFPDYMTGDECLFCHRPIGQSWHENRHQITIRAAQEHDPAIKLLREQASDTALSAQVDFLMGSRYITRFLRRSAEYGKLELLTAAYVPPGDERQPVLVAGADDLGQWDATTFANRCAGCHATAVDAQTRAFSAVSLDCVMCHGEVELEHANDVSQVLFSSQNSEPRQVISTCGQCHLRGGRSRSSGLPYPNTFVAGDNLLRDFQVDLTEAAIQALPAGEQHIFANARDVAVLDNSALTCVTCHDVHAQSSEKHQQLENQAICWSCHVPGTDSGELQDSLLLTSPRRIHSRVCDY